MTAKVVVIGLDSPAVSLLDRWADAGVMPAFAKLAKAAAIFDLDSHVGYLPDSVWPEFSTGRSVGSIGQFDYPSQIHTGEARPRPIAPEEIEPDRYFWSVASLAGRRVAVVDIPFGVKTPGLNGVQVHGWFVHGRVYPRVSEPDNLLRDLEQRHGSHPAGHCDEYPANLRALERLAGELAEGLRRRKSLLVDVLSRDDWDLFVCTIAETHCIGHRLWHVLDSRPGFRQGPTSAKLETLVRSIYPLLDETIAAVIEAAGYDSRVAVFASHGMGPYIGGTHLIPEFLTRLGMQGHGEGELSSLMRKLYRKATGPLRAPGRTAVFEGLVRSPFGQALLSPIKKPTGSLTFPLESSATKAIGIYNNDVGAIRLNLKGRDPHGSVAPGAEADALLDEIEHELRALEDPKTGKPVVRKTSRSLDVFGMDHDPDLPDLFVEFRDDVGTITTVRSPRVGTISIPLSEGGDRRTGSHRPGSRLWMSGPGVPRDLRSSTGHVLDVAPSVLRLLDVPLPNDLDGRPLELRNTGQPLSTAG